MKQDLTKKLNTAIETGIVYLGTNKTLKSLLNEEPKMVIISKNCPHDQKETITYYCKLAQVPCLTINQNSIDIGSSIGRDYGISAISILDEGESSILEEKQ